MATLQLVPVTTLNGTTYATAQIIITPLSPDRRKLILPKLEPASGSSACNSPSEAATAAAARALKSRRAFLDGCRPKRKLSFGSASSAATEREEGGARATRPAASISKRNARERNRVKQVNQGFVTLASHVPSNMRPKKMSKVETLKSAIKYIRYLRQVIEQQLGCGLSEHEAAALSLPQQPLARQSPPQPAAMQQQLQQQQRHFAASAPESAQQCSTLRLGQAAAYAACAGSCSYSADHFTAEALAASLPQMTTTATATTRNFLYDTAVAGFATPPYDVPSPTGSATSSSFTCSGSSSCSNDAAAGYFFSHGDSDAAMSPPYETSLSQDEQDLLDFASWFD